MQFFYAGHNVCSWYGIVLSLLLNQNQKGEEDYIFHFYTCGYKNRGTENAF